MVNKTFLGLAIAAATAGLTGCNISSVDGNDRVDQAPIESGSGQLGPAQVAPIFSAGSANLPVNIDLLFAEASTTDGTANTDDTTPPVTTALNRLDGFSTSAANYIHFNAPLDADTVVAGQTVFLIKLKNGTDNAAIDALDLASIVANSGASPVASDQPVPGVDYEARYITLNEGDLPSVQILPKTPLSPKTKYIVVLTNGIESASGTPVGSSAEYDLMMSELDLPSTRLQPVRDAIQAWEGIAGAFLNAATSGQLAQDDVILSYAMTTTGTTDVLEAMAAPATFVTSQISTIDAAETVISATVIAAALAGGADQTTAELQASMTLDGAAAQVAAGINAQAGMTVIPVDASTRDTLKASDQFSPIYYRVLVASIADGQGAGIDAVVDKPQSRTYSPISTASGAVALPYDAFLSSALESTVRAGIEAQVRATPALEGVDEAIIQLAIDTAIAANLATELANAVGDLSSGGAIYQGGLTTPNYLPEAEVGLADNELGHWRGSNNAALALGSAAAPVDKDGSINVTYRFPFADKLGDVTIPVLATLPPDDCDPDGAGPASGKPDNGWPVVIYQHGITVDRTAGLLVGNALAGQCIAMVAIDHAMHGVAPLSGSGENALRLFNIEQVSTVSPETTSPFAAARAAYLTLVPDSPLADLKERHNNVGKVVAGGPNVAMVFQGANGVTDESVGASGDLYINLQDFIRTRDGMRQTVLDLLNLNASLGEMDINGDGVSDDLDTTRVYFIGHSLGGIVGTTFLAVNNSDGVQSYNTQLPEIKAAALGNPGGGVVKLLENSPTIGTRILAGLSALGIEQGSDSIEKFFAVFQAAVDSADPINFADQLTDLPILVYEDVGLEGDASEPSDQVVPNNAFTATPAAAVSLLAGTDPLVAQLGITDQVNAQTAIAGGAINAVPQYYYPNVMNEETVRANIRLALGNHATFSSADPQDVFVETYQQIITYFDPYGVSQLMGLPGDQKGFLLENTTLLESSN